MKNGKPDDGLPWVVVDWLDSATENRWVTMDEAKALPPYRCRSVGMLVCETQNNIVLTLTETLHTEEDKYLKLVGDPLSIPLCAITGIRTIPKLSTKKGGGKK